MTGPRVVRLDVAIQTFGEHCHSENWEQSCPRLFGESDGAWCGLFGSYLLSRGEDDEVDGSYRLGDPVPRCDACLALDGEGT